MILVYSASYESDASSQANTSTSILFRGSYTMSVMKIFVHHRVVEFHETDAAGLVHFSNYFRWAEAAEHALFREIDYPMMNHQNDRILGWPRVRAQAKYSAPFHNGEKVRVELTVKEVKDRAIEYAFKIFREADDVLAAKGSFSTVHVAFDNKSGEMTSLEIPEELRALLASTT